VAKSLRWVTYDPTERSGADFIETFNALPLIQRRRIARLMARAESATALPMTTVCWAKLQQTPLYANEFSILRNEVISAQKGLGIVAGAGLAPDADINLHELGIEKKT
jgi:hypothetical protein